MGDSGIGSTSPPLPFIDGGGPVRTRERKTSHPPGGGEALGSQEEERKKDKEVRKGKPADSEKARPSSERANLQSENVKPRVVSDDRCSDQHEQGKLANNYGGRKENPDAGGNKRSL